MKARVKATGNIVDVEWRDHNSMGAIYMDVTHTAKYYEYELDFDTVYDYWTRLEHQAAIGAMQALLSSDTMMEVLSRRNNGTIEEEVAREAFDYAHALVGKMKEERK